MSERWIEPEKYFIVGDWDEYDATIFRFQLDPGRCFQCASLGEAVFGVLVNRSQCIPASVWTTAGRLTPKQAKEAA